MQNSDFEKFMHNAEDYGVKPIDKPLEEQQRKLVALAMAVNAAVIQFVNEGILEPAQQIHFMMHVQDFANQLIDGGKLRLENTPQTLAVDSAAGRLYHTATEIAFKHGSENFARLKELGRQQAMQNNDANFDPETNGDANVGSKTTLH